MLKHQSVALATALCKTIMKKKNDFQKSPFLGVIFIAEQRKIKPKLSLVPHL